MSANIEVINCLSPLFKYLVNSTVFSQLILDKYCNEIERDWKNIKFSCNTTPSEVLDYYNRWINNECDEDSNITNSELYLFIRYFILVCALDSYGRCESVEGMYAALERGRQHLNGGLLNSLKSMEPWKQLIELHGGTSKPLMDWMVNIEHPTWFTKLDNIDKEKENDIREQWRAILKNI